MAKTMKKDEATAAHGKIEDKLHEIYGGRDQGTLPTTLMFDHVSPATRLLEKRRQMFEVQEALNSQKDEFNRREDAYRRREDGLRRKDLELQESLIKFNKFLQENESKRNRALRRAAEERKQQDQKDIEIKKLEKQLQEKLLEEGLLKDEVEKNLQFQEYLENVCQSMSKYFPEISDILSRYKTLRDANVQLLQTKAQDDEERDTQEREYNVFKKEKENQLLNQNNEIAEMQIKLEKSIAATMELQRSIDGQFHVASDKALTLGTVLSSASNVLNRCEESFRRRHNKPMVDTSSSNNSAPQEDIKEGVDRTLLKLDEIAMFMVDFIEIKRDFKNSGAATEGIY